MSKRKALGRPPYPQPQGFERTTTSPTSRATPAEKKRERAMQKDAERACTDDPGTVFLPARTIPTPVSISAEARACLAALERMSHLRQPWPEGNDAETWRRAIAAANAHFGPVMAGMEDLPIVRADE